MRAVIYQQIQATLTFKHNMVSTFDSFVKWHARGEMVDCCAEIIIRFLAHGNEMGKKSSD